MNLSLGERPVYLPVTTVNAPVFDNFPSPLMTACSINFAGSKLRKIDFGLVIPRLSKLKFYIFSP